MDTPKTSPLDLVPRGKQRKGLPAPADYTPAELWRRAVDYFEFMRGRTWTVFEAVKSGPAAGTLCELPAQTPLQLRGFLIFAGLTLRRWAAYSTAPEFADVCERIEMMIETQNIEGAMVGAYNGHFAARLLKLADRTEAAVEVRAPRDLAPEEFAAFRKSLNDEL